MCQALFSFLLIIIVSISLETSGVPLVQMRKLRQQALMSFCLSPVQQDAERRMQNKASWLCSLTLQPLSSLAHGWLEHPPSEREHRAYGIPTRQRTAWEVLWSTVPFAPNRPHTLSLSATETFDKNRLWGALSQNVTGIQKQFPGSS